MNAETDRCVECDAPREEWPRDRVITGELTRGDVNGIRSREGNLGPICSKACMLERDGEYRELFGHGYQPPAPRFGGPGRYNR